MLTGLKREKLGFESFKWQRLVFDAMDVLCGLAKASEGVFHLWEMTTSHIVDEREAFKVGFKLCRNLTRELELLLDILLYRGHCELLVLHLGVH